MQMHLQRWWREKNLSRQATCSRLLERPSAVQEGLLAIPDRSLAAAHDILIPKGEYFQGAGSWGCSI